MRIKEFPTTTQVKAAIQRLDTIEWPLYTNGCNVDIFVKRVMAIVFQNLAGLWQICMPWKQNQFTPSLFRVRELNGISNLDLICEYSYPPANCAPQGRCNFPGYPVFYCSDNPVIALKEASRSDNKSCNVQYCLSVWAIDATEDTFIFKNFLKIPLPEQNLHAKLNQNFKERLNASLYYQLTEDQLNAIEIFQQYLDNLFISDKNYCLSASLAHYALYAPHNFRTDMLMYPSMQSGLQGVNYALAPNFVNQHMKLKRVYTLKINAHSTQALNVSFLRIGQVEKNVILWADFNPHKHFDIIKCDFGEEVIMTEEK